MADLKKLTSELMTRVHALYREYGATEKDILGRDRLTYIEASFLTDLKAHPGLFEELNGSETAQNFYVMQALLDMVTETSRSIETPVGRIVAYPKHCGSDMESDYPGVFIDLQRKGTDDIMLACVEWVLPDEGLQCCVYADCCDDSPVPNPIRYVNLEESFVSCDEDDE